MFDCAITVILAVGVAYGVVSSLWGTTASLAVLVFPMAGLLAAVILFRRHAFLCAIISGVMAAMALVSTLMATGAAFVELIPEGLASEGLRSQALHAMLVFSAVLSLVVFVHSPAGWSWNPPTRREQSFARVTLWPALVGAQVIAMLTLRGPLITKAGYWSAEYAKSGGEQDVGLEAIGLFLLVYSILAGLRGYGLRHIHFRVTVVVVLLSIVYFRILRGERASVVGFAAFFAVLYYMLSSSRYKGLVVGLSCLLTFAFIRVWVVARWEASFLGLFGSLELGLTEFWDWVAAAKGADRVSESFWYMLHVVNLYEGGIRRNGITYLNLIPQMVPAAIADAIGYVRPLAEPWVLAGYVEHGGGIHMTAEAYWNFGLTGMVVVPFVLGWMLIGVEKLYRRLEAIFVYGYFGIIVLNLAALTVGVQSFVRGVEIGLLLTGLGWLSMYGIDSNTWDAQLSGEQHGTK